MPIPDPDRDAAKRASTRAYGARYRALHLYVRVFRSTPLPHALTTAALEGIPDDWRTADTLGPGAYLWHGGQWQRIVTIPFVCPHCNQTFFVENDSCPTP